MTKYGVVALSQGLRVTFAPRGIGVSVLCLCFGVQNFGRRLTIVLRFGVPRFRPPRFVPGFDPLGICNSQLFRSGMWRAAIARRCLCSSLPAHIARARRPLELGHRAKGPAEQPL